MLDKKNAGVFIKVAAALVALAFIGAYLPGLFQTGPSGPQQNAGNTAQSNQQYDTRAKDLSARLKANPKDFGSALELGNLYWDAGGTNAQAQDVTAAARYFRLATVAYGQALKLKPTEANVRTDMATAFFYSGDAVRAKKELAVVLKENPNHPNALFNLGLIAKQTGDTKTARAAWEKYLKVDPNGANAAKVKQELPTLQQQ